MMVYEDATRRLAGSSGQIAGDRVLDFERFGFPLRLFAAAQPLLGRRPPGATVLAGEHDPIPSLDNAAERP